MWLTELKKLGIDFLFFIAGACGMFVASTRKPDFIWWRFLLDTIAGGLTAVFITPVFTDLIRLGHNGELAVAFGVGGAGYKTFDLFIEWLTIKFKKQ